jgi:hypothetical protein
MVCGTEPMINKPDKMKTKRGLCILVVCLVLHSAFLVGAFSAPARRTPTPRGRGRSARDKSQTELDRYAEYTKVISGGYRGGNQVFIQIGDHVFYDDVPGGVQTAGLYVVAIRSNRVLLQRFYNTYISVGASEGLGAEKGLFGQEFRTSYLCIGVKGLSKGRAIEKIGAELQEFAGPQVGKHIDLVFRPDREQSIATTSGMHKGLMIGNTEVIYYIPDGFEPDTAQYLFGIHDRRPRRRLGAIHIINQFKDVADRQNLVVIAPIFDCIFNRRLLEADFTERGGLKDRTIIKELYLVEFPTLLTGRNEHRSDLKLVEIFELFNESLMKREKSHFYGHSTGAEFVARFILFHPELVDRAAVASAETYTFPRPDIDYPYGVGMDNLEKTFGGQIRPDGMKLEAEQWERRFDIVLDVKLFIVAGQNDRWTDRNERTLWQGANRPAKAEKFYKSMRGQDIQLKRKGVRSQSKRFQFELHIMPGVGQNSGLCAQKAAGLLFPSKG